MTPALLARQLLRAAPARRALSTTRALGAIKVTNPRTADDGSPMLLKLTERAIARLAAIQAKDKNPALALRLTVESGGCHGFQYTIGLSDAVDAADDTLFTDEASGARVVVDAPSLELLKGSTVDYTRELIGSQFKVVNPAASSSCGCGTSFDIKF